MDASALNEFASAAGLFFFALLPDGIGTVEEDRERGQEEPLTRIFNDPSQLYLKGRFDATLRFLLQTPIRKPGLHMSPELRNNFLR